MKKVKVLGLIATFFVFAFCISSCKQTGAGGIETSGKKEVTFSIEQKDLVTKSTKSATIKADAKYVVVSIANDAGLVYDTKRLDLYNFSGSFISEPISLDIATTPYKVTKFLVLDANNVVIYATPLEGSALAPMVDDPLPINFTVSKDQVTKVVPQVLATESIPVKDFGYVAFDFDVMASPLYFRTCVQIYNPATANWMLTTADISITGTPGDVALYNNPIAAITDIVRVSDGYTSYKISVSKTGYATKEIVLTNAQLKTYMENPLIVLLIEPGVVKGGYGLIYNLSATDASNIAPAGWHVPTYVEWTTLTTFLGGESVARGKLKETGLTHWNTPNTGATNEVGFSALPGGCRGADGTFQSIGYSGYWWSAGGSHHFVLSFDSSEGGLDICGGLSNGHSIRLIKDDSTDPGTLTDKDGNIYKTVKIGNQVWTTSNWKCTKYNDGTPIPNVTDNAAWSALTTGAWCVYDNDINNK